MSMITTYTCDRCKCSWASTDKKQIWTVAIYSSCRDRGYCGGLTPTGKQAEWCRACYETLGIVPQIESKPAALPILTIGDMLREIIRTVVQEEMDNA